MRLPVLAVAVATAAAVAPPAAAAAPVTVDLRIEGPDSTIFEGPVTTDVVPIDMQDGTGSHTCDGTNSGGPGTPGPVRGNALVSSGVPFKGTWSTQFEEPSFDEVGGVNVSYDATTQRYLAEYKNEQFAQVGACADPIADGDRVLFAYATGSEKLLKLTGPATVAPGAAFTVKVTNAATGDAVAGAGVGNATTGADGTATLTAGAGGPERYKASAPDSIRSNALNVCATNGADGNCGTTVPVYTLPCATNGRDGLCGTRDLTAPAIAVAKLKASYRKRGPRTLRGTASDAGGLRYVKLRLLKRRGKGCLAYSKKAERFRPVRSCAKAPFFAIGDRANWSYLLPSAPRRGSYIFDAVAVDRAGNRSALQRQRFRVR